MHPKRIALCCETCGKTFEVQPYRQSTARFCSLECLGKSPKPKRRKPAADRLWARVDKTGPCWLWVGPTDTKGYGQLRCDGRLQMAHRVSWQIQHGAIPDGLCVLHHCDVPRCVNPAHLFLGTKGDNNVDRDQKGRMKYLSGEDLTQATLTEDQVRAIRARHAAGEGRNALARAYGVSSHCIYAILHRRTWRHVK